MTIINKHVFLNGKVIEFHCKKNVFEGLTGCVRERKTYQTNINNYTQNHPAIDGNSMH